MGVFVLVSVRHAARRGYTAGGEGHLRCRRDVGCRGVPLFRCRLPASCAVSPARRSSHLMERDDADEIDDMDEMDEMDEADKQRDER